MKTKAKNMKNSIVTRIVFPVVLASIIQSATVAGVLYFSVIKDTINNSLITNFESSVNVRKNYVENLITNTWSNIGYSYSTITSETESFLETFSYSSKDILNDETHAEEYLLNVSPYLNDMITQNKVNDAYIILNNNFNGSENKLMTYMRTKNPSFTSNNEVEIVYAPTKVWKSFYHKGYGLNNDIENNQYLDLSNKDLFERPLQYYQSNKVATGYWSPLTVVKSTKVLTYSKPLIVNNEVIGVLGVGLTEAYLKTSFATINKGEEINVSLIRKKDGVYSGYFNSFVDYSLPKYEDVTFSSTNYENVKQFTKEDTVEYYFEEHLTIYNENPYNEEWYVVGISPEKTILQASNRSVNQIILICVISLIAIFALFILIGNLIAKPIVKVSSNLNENNIHNIPKTNITEVDTLITQINSFSKKNVSLNNKLNRIIQDSSMQIALSDYSKEDNSVSVTVQFFEMLGLDYKDEVLSLEKFIELLSSLEDKVVSSTYEKLDLSICESSGEITFLINGKYLQMKIIAQDTGAVGTLIDQTKDFEEKEKIIHERDFDLLTGLLNRRGFASRVNELIETQSPASIFMMDVDSLKYINDQYGHDFGDEYLKKIGSYLGSLKKDFSNLYVCHVSGDEFILYLYDKKDGDEDLLIEKLQKLREEYLLVKDARIFISLSIGICEYQPGMDYKELSKKADFAMYLAKTSGKNNIRRFDNNAKTSYQNETLLYQDLNKIIDEKLIDFAYQPIVDIHTGEILGYEALMRPKVDNLSPLTVLNAAKRFNKLYEIEAMTAFMSPEKFFATNKTKRLFFNSISSQSLTDEDVIKFIDKYGQYLDRIVIEIIEEDFGENSVIKRKTDIFDDYHIRYAIDDYGTGFNNISMILDYSPRYIKIEGSIIRNIDKDEKKLILAKSIISYCSVNHIKVVAESVETVEELKVVKDIGVDYVQGYLLAKPSFDIVDLPEEKKELIRKLNEK